MRLVPPRMLTPHLPRDPTEIPHQPLIRALGQRSPHHNFLVVLGAVPFGQVDPDAARGDFATGVVGDFYVVFLLGEFALPLDRHAVVEVLFVHLEEFGFGDVAEGDAVARDGGPDCEGGAGELGAIGGEAGGEGERHFGGSIVQVSGCERGVMFSVNEMCVRGRMIKEKILNDSLWVKAN